MRGNFLLALAAAALFAASPAGAAPDDVDGTAHVISVSVRDGEAVHKHLTLGLNKAAIVEIDADARDVLVANPEIVDAVVRSPRRIFLLAQKTGQTNAFFFDASGRQLLSIDIRVERDVTDLAAMIRKDFPDSQIKVSAMNDNVVLSGKIASAEQSTRAQDIAARFVGDPAKVVNMLQITGSQQVMLKVRIAEVQRQVAKQLGIDLTGAATIGGVPIIASTSNPYGLAGQALSDLSGAQFGNVCPQQFIPGITKTITNMAINNVSNNPALLEPGAATGVTTTQTTTVPCSGQNNIQGVMKALETVGLVHTLAEPNLIAVSGETAKFLAGGEFPVPAGRDAQGNVSVTFKQFGVGLSFTPVVLSDGLISLQLSTEVSELTNTGAFTMSGGTSTNANGQTVTVAATTIPALSVRRAETTVELPSGGSFAIAGLMQHVTKQQLDGFPGLTDMPILGALFRSRDFQNNETELVVTVTAYLVHPTTEAKLALPTDGFVPPTDVETILLGRVNAVYDRTKHPITEAQGKFGFIVQ
ncbi:MAG: type II and III secretion system protein family protein [Alphaproteobacteria bacterium]|nr:type II and III secretion system protein family protein [Alphaproteobacteria bacterium]MDE2112795.1 type II and III secretion system protein family protein [Alphaproteobacteria bacterium]MDE2493308.1 type II and III secretion system protein family protein [Alphaproteobacteria bacterium]